MINLSNYEEYFLLYIDNELSTEQGLAVELFVVQHPHLKAELNMLQETKLPLEETDLFSDKNSLYKAAGSSINIHNYEEYFLLHTDKELSAAQEKEVEHFVLQHPQMQEEFLLLQQTKLTPEHIEYPDKKLLYKHRNRRLVPLYFTRIAVAAAVTGAILLIGNLIINNNSIPPQIAGNTRQSQPVKKNTLPQNKTTVVLPGKKKSDVLFAKNSVKQADKVLVKSTKAGAKEIAFNKNQNKENNKQQELIKVNTLPEIQQTPPAPDALIATNNKALKQDRPAVLKPLQEVNDNETTSNVMYASNDYSTAKPAVYKEIDTDDDEQTQTLYVGSLQLNKAKVNGLFKKATHLLGNKVKESSL